MNPTTTQITIDPYSSSTGAGTLGYYARKYNTTTDELMKLNPNIKSPDLIQSGASLNVPTYTQPSVQTSSMAREAVNNANTYIDSQQKPIVNTTSQPQYGTNQNNTPDINTTNQPQDTTPPDIANLNKTYDAMGANLKTQVDSLVAGLDASTTSMIQQLTDTYMKRINEQKDINSRYLESARASGYSSGRARYASEIQDQILSKEEQNGLQRIKDLEAERDNLISQARAARDSKSQAALIDYHNKLIEIDKEKRAAVQELFKNSMDLERLNMDKAKEYRASIKDRIDSSMKTAESIAGSVVDYLDSNKLSKEEQDRAFAEWSNSYGLSEDYLRTAVKNYRMEMSKANPSSIQEYEYFKKTTGYTGNLLDYQRAKQAASRVASSVSSGGGEVFTFDDARRYDLPEELIGRTDKEVIMDLSVSKVPDWFRMSQIRSGNLPPEATEDMIAADWNKFRNSGDMMVLRNTVDINKAGKDNANTLTAEQQAAQILEGL